jgi:hypothetical protein
MNLFGTVTAEDMRSVQIATGVAMAVFIGSGVVPALRPYAGRIRLALLFLYLGTCGAFVARALLR